MRLKLTTIAALSALAAPAGAADLVYGNWTPAREYQNVNVMPEAFRMIEKETDPAKFIDLTFVEGHINIPPAMLKAAP